MPSTSETDESRKPMSEEEIARTLKAMADGWSHPMRSPILKTPADYGLAHDDVTFPSQDGVPLEGWFVPCPGSRRLVIANHPLQFNRYGCPSHLEPWRSFGAQGGNTFEVDYVPDIRILHDAGYHVLTYDERNFGLSGAANGGTNSGGRYEARDVIGSLAYARSRPDLAGCAIGLFSRCNGCNATMYAIHSQPEHFTDVACLIACQPLSVGSAMLRDLERLGLADRLAQLDEQLLLAASITLDRLSPVDWAPSIRLPTFVYQVHDDLMTRPDDVQAMFDALPAPDKTLHWIHGTTARWDGYLEFQRRPQPMLDWLERHMA